MVSDGQGPVAVTRRIGAPAGEIFRVLADPRKHVDFDGSGMLRGAVSEALVSGVGDVFVMRMYYDRLGHYEMNNHVVAYEPDRLIAWEPEAGRGHPDAGAADARWGQCWSFALAPDGPEATTVIQSYDCSRVPAEERAAMAGGRVWIASMTQTLARLDELCTGEPVTPTDPAEAAPTAPAATADGNAG
jgi:hypothetical protein